MRLRDHDQECKHGAMGPHTVTLTDSTSTVPSLFANVGICPGGRKVKATELPWCAEHGDIMMGALDHDCRLEKPARHYVLEVTE